MVRTSLHVPRLPHWIVGRAFIARRTRRGGGGVRIVHGHCSARPQAFVSLRSRKAKKLRSIREGLSGVRGICFGSHKHYVTKMLSCMMAVMDRSSSFLTGSISPWTMHPFSGAALTHYSLEVCNGAEEARSWLRRRSSRNHAHSRQGGYERFRMTAALINPRLGLWIFYTTRRVCVFTTIATHL